MSAWSETITLTAPLRDAILADPPPGMPPMDPMHRDAWQAGYEQGRLDGEKNLGGQLLKQRAELQELLNGTLNSLRQAIPQVVRDTESTMVSLALEVARKLVSDMPISVPMVEAAVRDALTHVESSAQVTVRLHPADLELLQTAGSPLLGSPRLRMIFASSVPSKSAAAAAWSRPVSERWMPGAKLNLT